MVLCANKGSQRKLAGVFGLGVRGVCIVAAAQRSMIKGDVALRGDDRMSNCRKSPTRFSTARVRIENPRGSVASCCGFCTLTWRHAV